MKAVPLTPALVDYLDANSMTVNPVLAELAAETSKHPLAIMQITKSQGALMHLLAKLIGARRIVEVGTFTGYSAIAMGAALPADGHLYTLDIDPETTQVAQRYFDKAGLSDRIHLRLGPASDSLAKLLQEYGRGSFDMMFIDADKPGMPTYYEYGLELLRPGGLIIADNVLFGGAVLDPDNHETNPEAIRRFNERVRGDERCDRAMINVADGLTLFRKRG
jgi:predicted O-methyltransferase YrrM